MNGSTQCRLAPYWQQILTSYFQGSGDFAWQLGLTDTQWQWVLDRYASQLSGDVLTPVWQEHLMLRLELAQLRADEREALLQLFGAAKQTSMQCMKQVIATTCLSPQHLWQDLGLQSRGQLSALLQLVLPDLVVLNTQNMRWKRFFYRQLCVQGGDFVCRSPNCEACPSYQECFV